MQSQFTTCLRLYNQQLEMVSTYKYVHQTLLRSNDLFWSKYVNIYVQKHVEFWVSYIADSINYNL